jgi:hypothetical protein
MKKLFEIQTLSECHKPTLSALGQDPFTALIALIPSILNIFGNTPLTMADLDKIFTGNGQWTVALKQHLLNNIAWVDENLQKNIDQKMKAFISGSFAQTYCQQELNSGCFQHISYGDVLECPACTTKFYEVLQKEKVGWGTPSPYPGNTLNLTTLVLIGGGVFLLVMASKKKGKRK